jgi:hypothetical protein
LLVPKVELFGLDLLPVVGCRDVVDGRMAVNCFVLEEHMSESLEKKKQVCLLGDGEFRKKKKLGLFRSWKKILGGFKSLWSGLQLLGSSMLGWFEAQSRQLG